MQNERNGAFTSPKKDDVEGFGGDGDERGPLTGRFPWSSNPVLPSWRPPKRLKGGIRRTRELSMLLIVPCMMMLPVLPAEPGIDGWTKEKQQESDV